ncbi:hypothetical protein FRC12_004280 [Ceratobasidium sp. 428]|nr:hypothetical protein FRC12_004280 [Ceratobasidium sp. 428]
MNIELHNLSLAIHNFRIQPEGEYRQGGWYGGSLSCFLNSVHEQLSRAVPGSSSDSPCMKALWGVIMDVWLHEDNINTKLQKVPEGGQVDPDPNFVHLGYIAALTKLELWLSTPHPEDQTDPVIMFMRNELLPLLDKANLQWAAESLRHQSWWHAPIPGLGTTRQ